MLNKKKLFSLLLASKRKLVIIGFCRRFRAVPRVLETKEVQSFVFTLKASALPGLCLPEMTALESVTPWRDPPPLL